jgi:hypothetical protein
MIKREHAGVQIDEKEKERKRKNETLILILSLLDFMTKSKQCNMHTKRV